MLYGNKLVYAYEDIDEREEGKVVTKKLDLTFSPITFIKYQNYTGKDFMADFMALNFSIAGKISPELKQKIEKGEEIHYQDITEDDIKGFTSQDSSKNIEFFINAVASMVATTAYPKVLDFGEIMNSLPIFLFYDDVFLSELTELISFGLKKNSQMVTKAIARIKLN
jgi:hypothetical protein